MANTIADVRTSVEMLNVIADDDFEFRCWGVETNKYQLAKEDTGETVGPQCSGSSEFLMFLKGYVNGLEA